MLNYVKTRYQLPANSLQFNTSVYSAIRGILRKLSLFVCLAFLSLQAAAQSAPGSFTITGPTSAYQGTSSSYNPTTGTPPGSGYQWSLSNSSAGSITQVGNGCSITWSTTFTGSVTVNCRAINQYGATNAPGYNVNILLGLTSGTISSSVQTINYNTVPTAWTCSAATGGGGGYTYQWQSSPDNSTWTSISGATSLTYAPPALTATTYYRVVSSSGGASVYSNAAYVVVNPLLVSGTASSSQTINYNTTPASLSATAATGGSGTYTYQWQSSPDNSTWTNVSGATGTTYAPGALTSTTYYRIVSSSYGISVNSNSVTITVYPMLLAGGAGSNQSINYNTAPSAISSTAATGGSGSYTYQWQSSPDGSTWTNVSGATSLTYAPGALTANTYYHVVTTSNGATVPGNTVIIAVYPQLVSGTASSSQTINYNTTPSAISSTAATGGNSAYTYQWQSSPDNSTWTNVTGATSLSYAPGVLTATTYYRIVSTSNGVNVNSNVLTITVYPQLVAGALTSGTQSINYNTIPAAIVSAAATGGNGTYTYQWQSSPDNSTWTNVTGATALSYTPPALTANTYYHLISTSNGVNVTGTAALVTVYPQLVAGAITSGTQTINYNTIPAAVVSAAATGGNSSYTYQWQSSPNNSTWTNVSGATALSYTPPALTATTYYHLVSTSNGVSIAGTAATVTVYPQLVAGAITSGTQSINYNTVPSAVVSAAATGGNSTYTYQWQNSPDNSTWTNVTGATSLSYTAAALTANTYYHLISTSNGVNVTGTAALVTVYPQLVAGALTSGTQTINYNTVPAAIVSAAATGGNSTYTYQWQSSPNNSTWTNVSGATALSYTPPALTANTYYHLISTSNGVNVTGTAALVTVYPQLVAGALTSGTQSINYNTVPAAIVSAAATGGSGTYTYQWQSSPNNSTWTNVSGAISLSYTPSALTATTYYHLVSTSNGVSLAGTAATVTVYPQLAPGALTSGTQTINYNTVPAAIVSAAATGGSGTYTYQWQNSPNNSTWTNITGATALSYTPPALTATTYYHLISTSNGVSITGATATVTVNSAALPAISYATPQTYNVGTTITPLTVTNTEGSATANGQTSTLAGSGTAGAINGTGTAAAFFEPCGVVTDKAGNVYVADLGNNLIRKVTPAGVVTTLAGSGAAGSTNGTGAAASFYYPQGMAIDGAGNLYVAERHNNMIRKITPAGVVTTLAGNTTAGFANGTGTAASFNLPASVAVDASGNVFVADYGNSAIRMITPAGVVTTFAGSGTVGHADGTGTAATFNTPTGIAFDQYGNLMVADYRNNMIRKITPAAVVTTIAGNTTAGYIDATGTAAEFNNPYGITVDAAGNMFVADELNNRIRAISPAGVVTTLSGNGTAGAVNGVGTAAEFNQPFGLTIDGNGNLYIGGYSDNIVRKIAYAPFSISPQLPAGLSFNAYTGAISGTPSVTSALTTYTVSAYSAVGTSTASINITINGGAPVNASKSQNYVATYIPRVPGFVSSTPGAPIYVASSDKTQVQVAIQYIDGIGRPLQTVQVKGSAGGNDLVQPAAYDAYGREATKYLPYALISGTDDGSYKTDALTPGAGQAQFYASPPAGVSVVANPYAQVNYDNSPLNRTIEQGAPGAAWQLSNSGVTGSGHTVQMVYKLNNATTWALDSVNSRQVALYNAAINSDGSRTLSPNGYYPANQLTVTISKNENWVSGRAGIIEEYKDKEGHVVLKRVYNYVTLPSPALQQLSTYYVYDDLGDLAFVLPPASNADADGAITQTTLDNLCYQYQYDERGRMIQKKIPGKGWEYMAYNYIDQPVATQDANQRANNQWVFTKYDDLGRPVMTGIWNNGGTNGTAIARATLQSTLTGITSNLWETPVNTGSGYNNVSWPTTNTTAALTTNFYDTYANIPGLPATYNVTTGRTNMIRGLLTIKKVAVLNAPADQLWGIVYYDDLGRNIKTYAQHYLGGTANTNNYDLISTTYNFTNAPTMVTRQHWNTTSTTAPLVTIANTYIYDHLGRKLKSWEQITNGGSSAAAKTLLSQTNYNEIGQVMNKQLHSTDSVNFYQTITYTYNERGWLLGSSAPLFAMNLYYNTLTSKAYNGNIMYQSWGTPGNLTSQYAYGYDKLNRLTAGGSAANSEAPTYDAMGNIVNMSRYLASTAIDYLTYNYTNGGNYTNQVQSIVDASGSNSGLVNGTTSFTYDANGNELTTTNTVNTGQNKTFTYNLLNLPLTVTTPTGTLTYTYDATGNKLRKQSTGLNNKTDYIAGIQYDGATTPTLSFIQTEEGKAVPTTGGGYDYYYYLGDNLGNTRITFDTQTGTAVQLQKDDYMPFGMEINGGVTSPKNEYLYNKKELQEELEEYDYGARFYDPVIARWNTVDPDAENYEHASPYAYVLNNPINLGDLDGRDTVHHLKEVFIHATKPTPKPQEPIEVKPIERRFSPFELPRPPVFTIPILTLVFVLMPANYGDNEETVYLRLMAAQRDPKHPGSYTIKFKNGKRYHGKGPYKRAIQSAERISRDEKLGPNAYTIDWTPASSNEQAFRDEAKRLEADGGKNNPNNYNERDSPGSHKYKQEE